MAKAPCRDDLLQDVLGPEVLSAHKAASVSTLILERENGDGTIGPVSLKLSSRVLDSFPLPEYFPLVPEPST